MKTCARRGCNNTFEPNRLNPDRMWCSHNCGQNVRRSSGDIPWKLCVAIDCGNNFLPRNRNQKFCSASCRDRVKKMRLRLQFDPKPCKHCGTIFTPRSSIQAFCRDRCRKRAHHYYYYEPVDLQSKTCDRCKTEFKPKNNMQRFCSKQCQQRDSSERWLSVPENVEKMKIAKARWRAANPGYDARMQRFYYHRKKQQRDAA